VQGNGANLIDYASGSVMRPIGVGAHVVLTAQQTCATPPAIEYSFDRNNIFGGSCA
jgi:hypothetical protein